MGITIFIAIQIEEIQWAMSANEKQLSCLQEQERPLVQTFNEAIGDNKFKDFLTKVANVGEDGEGGNGGTRARGELGYPFSNLLCIRCLGRRSDVLRSWRGKE